MDSAIHALEKSKLKELNQVPSFDNILHGLVILLLYAVLSVTGFWLDKWYAWIPIWVYQGFILSGFLGASHDCAHGSFVRRKWGNRIIGNFWSSTVLFNFSLYKYYHLNHHKFTHVPGDTEPYGSFKNLWDYICTLPMTGFFFPFWKMSAVAPFNWFPTFIKTKTQQIHVKQDNIAIIFWLIAIATLTVLFPVDMLKIYWTPILIYFPMVFITSIPEHYDCEESADLTINTRTLESNKLFKYIFWNGNYHAEHHLYPSVPSRNLEKLHKIVGGRFKVREKSYFSFHRKMLQGILRHKRNPGDELFEPLERIVYHYYKASK